MLGESTTTNKIPMRGKHLDDFTIYDYLAVGFSKFLTPIFVFHVLQFSWHSGVIEWDIHKISAVNSIVALILLFIIFDFFYYLFHRFLHQPFIYKLIHKHHHRQMAPTRGNSDAINVHPIEFLIGEYNYLSSIYLLSFVIHPHIFSVLLFIVIGGILSSLNHTRSDIKLGNFYQVKFHDVHHWSPDANFSQYTILWDAVFGTFKAYPDKLEKGN